MAVSFSCPAKCGKRFTTEAFVQQHIADAHPDWREQGPARKGWVTPYGFADFTSPMTYEQACTEMKKATELFWPRSPYERPRLAMAGWKNRGEIMSDFIKMLTYKKGDLNEYSPEVGEFCLVSPPNCDDNDGYLYHEAKCLWKDNVFVLFQVRDCWPTIDKWEHIRCKARLPISPEKETV